MGRHIYTHATVCNDPISWFEAGLIRNPSLFLLGLPGLGKSSVSRRMVAVRYGFGTIPLVLGDLKPDYVKLIRLLGGQIITLGHGRGYINVLDDGDTADAVDRIRAEVKRLQHAGELLEGRLRETSDDELRRQLEQEIETISTKIDALRGIAGGLSEDAHNRKKTMVAALLTIQRQRMLEDWEETLIDQALRILEKQEHTPILTDLLELIQSGPESLREVALDGGDIQRYRETTMQLERSLMGLVRGGRLGDTFSRETTTRQHRDVPVAYDVSVLKDSEPALQGAVLMACWSAGFATIAASHALSDAGLEQPRNYLVVLDEMHRALRSGPGMVDLIDALTRLNRNEGVGQIMITHTMKDLQALVSEADAKKAIGLVERSGYVMLGGLPMGEMGLLDQAAPLSHKEQALVTSWNDPPPYDPRTGERGVPPGRGKFLIKVGGAPGIPFDMLLTAAERDSNVHDTNQRWHTTSSIGRVERETA